jgi:hypothetical protein
MNEIKLEQHCKHGLNDLKKKDYDTYFDAKVKKIINILRYTMFIVFYNFCLGINIFNNLDDLVLENV